MSSSDRRRASTRSPRRRSTPTRTRSGGRCDAAARARPARWPSSRRARSSRTTADLTRDVGAVQLSRRALAPRRMTGLHWESTGDGRAGAADHGPRAQRRRLVAHGAGAVAARCGSSRSTTAASGARASLCHSYTTEAMADDAVVGARRGRRRARARVRLLARRHGRPAARAAPSRAASARSCSARRTPAGRAPSRPDADVLAFFRAGASMAPPRRPRARRCRSTTARAAGASTPERIAEDIRRRLAHPFPQQAYRAQLFAAALHNCHRRLARIEAPTLVVHGRHDRMIPVANAEMLAERIPGAELRILEDVGAPVPDRASRRSTRRSRGFLARGPHDRAGARRRASPTSSAATPRERPRRGRAAPRRARADLRRARRALEPARAGAAGRRRPAPARASPTSTAPRPRSSSCCSRRAKIGAVLVPLNWRLSPPELAAVLADARGAAADRRRGVRRAAARARREGVAGARSRRASGDDYERVARGARAASIPAGAARRAT